MPASHPSSLFLSLFASTAATTTTIFLLILSITLHLATSSPVVITSPSSSSSSSNNNIEGLSKRDAPTCSAFYGNPEFGSCTAVFTYVHPESPASGLELVEFVKPGVAGSGRYGVPVETPKRWQIDSCIIAVFSLETTATPNSDVTNYSEITEAAMSIISQCVRHGNGGFQVIGQSKALRLAIYSPGSRFEKTEDEFIRMFANYQGSSTRPSYSGQGYITSYTNDPSSDPGDADKRLSRKRRTYCGRDGKGKDNCAEGETCQAEVFLGTDVSFGVPQQRAGWLDGFGLCVSVSKSLTRRSPSSADLVIAVSHPPSSPPNNDIVASPLLAPRTIPGAFPLAWLNLNDDYDYDDDTPFPTNTNSREVEEEQVFCNAQIYGSPTRDDCYEAWMQLPNDRSGERWVFYPESVGEWLGQDCVKTPQTWRWGNCIIAIRNLEGPGHRTTDQETWIHFVDHAAPAVINVCAEGGTGGIVLAGDHDDLSLSIYAPASPYHYYIELGIQCPADPVALTSAECLALQGPPGSSSINADQGDGSSPRSGGGSGGSGAVSTSLKVHVMNEATCDAVACASASDCCSGWACNRGTMAKGAAPIYWGSAAAVGGGRGGWCVSSGGGAGGEL